MDKRRNGSLTSALVEMLEPDLAQLWKWFTPQRDCPGVGFDDLSQSVQSAVLSAFICLSSGSQYNKFPRSQNKVSISASHSDVVWTLGATFTMSTMSS